MSFWKRIAFGFLLGKRSLGIILRDKTLALFPLISMGFTLAFFLFFYIEVGPDKLQLFLRTLRDETGVQSINYGYYQALAICFVLLTLITVAMNFALVACAHISLEHRDSKFRDGIAVSLRRIPAVVIWTLLSATLGIVLLLLDQERRCSLLIRRRLGSTWAVMTMLVAPVAVLEKTNILSAVRRSRALMRETWGEHLQPNFGVFWFLVFANLPLGAALIATKFLRDSGLSPTLAALAIGYFALTVIVALAAKSVLEVILYKYAASGGAPAGFPADLLQSAFESYQITVQRLPVRTAPVRSPADTTGDAPGIEAGAAVRMDSSALRPPPTADPPNAQEDEGTA